MEKFLKLQRQGDRGDIYINIKHIVAFDMVEDHVRVFVVNIVHPVIVEDSILRFLTLIEQSGSIIEV